MNKLWGREMLNKHNKNRACKAMQESQPTMEQIKKKHRGTNKRVVTGVFFYPKNTMNKSWKRLLSEILSLLLSCDSSWARSSVYSQLCTSVLGDITMHQLSVGRATWIQCGGCIKCWCLSLKVQYSCLRESALYKPGELLKHRTHTNLEFTENRCNIYFDYRCTTGGFIVAPLLTT